MVIAAWILGVLGGLCAVIGVVTATESVEFLTDLPAAFTPMFWLTLGIISLLSCIAAVLSRSEYE